MPSEFLPPDSIRKVQTLNASAFPVIPRPLGGGPASFPLHLEMKTQGVGNRNQIQGRSERQRDDRQSDGVCLLGNGGWIFSTDCDKLRAETSLFFSRSPSGTNLTYLRVVSGEGSLDSYLVTILFVIFRDHSGSLLSEQGHTCCPGGRVQGRCVFSPWLFLFQVTVVKGWTHFVLWMSLLDLVSFNYMLGKHTWDERRDVQGRRVFPPWLFLV